MNTATIRMLKAEARAILALQDALWESQEVVIRRGSCTPVALAEMDALQAEIEQRQAVLNGAMLGLRIAGNVES